MSRRGTYLPSRRATMRWFILRVFVVESFLAVALVLDMTSHIAGVR